MYKLLLLRMWLSAIIIWPVLKLIYKINSHLKDTEYKQCKIKKNKQKIKFTNVQGTNKLPINFNYFCLLF